MNSRARAYAVSIDVPRAGGWRAWNTAAERFEQALAAQVSPPVLDAQVDSETRQGLDYVRIRVAVSVRAADVAEALGAAWGVFREAAGEVGAWDLAAARAEVHPAGQRPARIRPGRRGLWPANSVAEMAGPHDSAPRSTQTYAHLPAPIERCVRERNFCKVLAFKEIFFGQIPLTP
jgi:hypothetical protein